MQYATDSQEVGTSNQVLKGAEVHYADLIMLGRVWGAYGRARMRGLYTACECKTQLASSEEAIASQNERSTEADTTMAITITLGKCTGS